MVINKKIMRTMLERKSQYAGSLVLIIISCMLFTMFNQLTINMTRLSSSFENNYVQEDASFISDKKLDIPNLESKFDMKLEETKSFDYAVSDDKTLRIFSQNTKVDIPAVIEGDTLKGSGDILIDPAYAKANNLDIDGSIKIYDKTFNIAGFMSLPNYVYPLKTESDLINDPNSFGLAVISKGDFNTINKGNSSYAVKFGGDKSDIERETTQFKDYLKSQNIVLLSWTDISENPRVAYVSAKIQGINEVSSSLPVLIILLTCVLAGIVVWRMMKKESVIIGTLYALGYRKREITRHYLTYPMSIALSGSILGTILGALLLKPMLYFMVSYFNMPVGSVSFDFSYVVISILLPVVFLVASGYLVVRSALKSSPVELMRGGREKAKVGLLERKLKLEKMRFKSKFKIREQLRSMPRSGFLFLGVILATMLLLLGFAANSSIEFLMKNTFQDTYKYNYQYVYNSLQQGKPIGGEAVLTSYFKSKSDSSVNITINGISSDSKYFNFKDKGGNIIKTDRVIITRPLADKLNLKPGETIRAVNKLDSREYSFKVDSIAETYVGEYVYMPLSMLDDMLRLPPGSYTTILSDTKLDIPENMLLSTSTIEDSRKSFESLIQPLQSVVGIMAFLSFIIGLIVIYVVTSLIIEENKESISLMKVFGYKKKEVNSLILNSSSFLIVAGYIVGVPLLLATLSALFNSISKSLNFAFPVTLSYPYAIGGLIVIYFAYEVSKALSRRKVSRISMAEILKAQME